MLKGYSIAVTDISRKLFNYKYSPLKDLNSWGIYLLKVYNLLYFQGIPHEVSFKKWQTQ
jgi:hypothetical protein